MKSLYESILTTTKKKVEQASKMTAADLYKEMGFPTENDWTDGKLYSYYYWKDPFLMERCGKEILEYNKIQTWTHMRIPTD